MKAYREVDGGGDLFSALDHQKKVTQRIVGILKGTSSKTCFLNGPDFHDSKSGDFSIFG